MRSAPGGWWLRGAVDHEVAAVLAVHRLDRVAHLLFHPVEAPAHARELVLEIQDPLDAGEVEADLGRQPLDQLQARDVLVRVETRVPGSAPGAYETLLLVDPQCL